MVPVCRSDIVPRLLVLRVARLMWWYAVRLLNGLSIRLLVLLLSLLIAILRVSIAVSGVLVVVLLRSRLALLAWIARRS